ncbi:MAG: branched-chain amino acid ABC transporter permease [Lachnospiraceae bacterium]|nr:branched-chain amino acid ABC transporter permease [Lachnospiraceae bacterium]
MKILMKDILERRSRIAGISSLVFFLALLILPFLLTNAYYLHVLILCMIYACITSAWNMIAGYAGVFSFGFQALFGIGAYVSALLSMRLGISPWISMWAGAIAAMAIGAVVAIPSLKLKLLPYICIATMCMGEIIRLAVANFTTLTRGEMGLTNIPKLFADGNRTAYYYLAVVMFVLILAVVVKIVNSPMGMSMQAMKDSQEASESLGINISRTKIRIYMIGAFMAGLVGAFYAHYICILTPTSALGSSLMTSYVAMSLIGGIGTIVGPVLGSFVITIALEVLRALADYRMIFYALLIIVTIIFLRAGIWGSVKQIFISKAERFRNRSKEQG